VSPSASTTYFATLYFNGMTQVVPIQVNLISEATLGNDVTVCSSGGMLMYDFTGLPFPGDYTMSNSNGFAIAENPDNVFNVNINNTPAGTYDLIVAQAGTTYSWSPTDNIIDPTVVNAQLFVEATGTYILTANNGCEIMDTVEVVLVENNIELQDTILVCLGDEATIPFTTNPPNDDVLWTTIDGDPLMNVPTPFTVTPDDVISYIATVENNGCTFSDTVTFGLRSCCYQWSLHRYGRGRSTCGSDLGG